LPFCKLRPRSYLGGQTDYCCIGLGPAPVAGDGATPAGTLSRLGFGPVGVRTDNGRFKFELFAVKAFGHGKDTPCRTADEDE